MKFIASYEEKDYNTMYRLFMADIISQKVWEAYCHGWLKHLMKVCLLTEAEKTSPLIIPRL